MNCIHLGEELGIQRRRVDQPIYKCQLYDECTLTKSRLRNCFSCSDFVAVDDIDIKNKWQDHLRIVDREGKRTHVLRNFLSGGAAFLVCGGPSLRQLDLEPLRQRGVFSLGVNNVAGYAPVSAFTCSDPPSKFHSGIFLDPKVMKLLPEPKLIHRKRGALRKKTKEGKFQWMGISTQDCPNTWGYDRRSWLACDDSWFLGAGAAWGNHDAGVKKTGEPKTVNTMFLGLRLLQYLGAKTIFLLGVDFYMNPTSGLRDNYAFSEKRDAGAVSSNNNQYKIANDWLIRLRPIFEKYGFVTYNCNPESHLRAFDYVPYETAVRVCRGQVPPEPFDLDDWYTK